MLRFSGSEALSRQTYDYDVINVSVIISMRARVAVVQ